MAPVCRPRNATLLDYSLKNGKISLPRRVHQRVFIVNRQMKQNEDYNLWDKSFKVNEN